MVIRCTGNKARKPAWGIDPPRRRHHFYAPNAGWGAGTRPPPRSLTLITVLFFGWLLILGGGFQLIDAFYCKGWKGTLAHVATALLYLLAGYLIIQDPRLASTTFTLIIAAVLIAVGLLRGLTAFQHRGSPGWIWALLGGLISILLGAVIIAHWPVSGLWVIGLFVAIELLMNGWASIFIALAARRAAQA